MLAGVSRRRRPEFLEGLSNHFLFFSFSWAFLPVVDLSVVGAFLSGKGSFLRGDSSFWSGGGAFFEKGDIFFSPEGGRSPLFGENKAFMAEPSDRPAINDGLGGRKKRDV